MKKAIFLLACLQLSFNVFSQIGIGANYLQTLSTDNWTNSSTVSGSQSKIIELPGAGFEAYVDYRMKLRSIRIEFYPTIAYSNHQQDLSLTTQDISAETTGWHFNFNSRIYPLDLEGDCDCPTWRKDGPTLEKGLFLQVGAGVSIFGHDLTSQDKVNIHSDETGFHFGAGLGFDLGINDLVTITPSIMMRYYPSLTWDGLEGENTFDFPEEIMAESNLIQYQLGLHLGFHLGR